MRLTCPSCDAIYEVDEIAIPASGRRVRCSACDEAWRVSGEGAVIAPSRGRPQVIADDEAAPAMAEEASPATAFEQPVEEADEIDPKIGPETGEASAGAAEEAPSDPAEPVAGPGADAADPVAAESAGPDESPAEPEAESEAEAAPAGEAPQEPQEKPKSTYTPLRAKRTDPAAAPASQDASSDRAKRPSPMRSLAGFMIGFAAIMILASPYLFRAEIVAAAPGAAPVVDAYANVVGQAQSGIRSVVDAVAVEVNYLVGGLAAPEQEAAAQAAGQ